MAKLATSRKTALRWSLFLVIIAIAILILWAPVSVRLRSMSVLTRFNNPEAHGFSAMFARHRFSEETGSAPIAQGQVKYRLYLPADVKRPPAILLLDGIQHLGIEDPRLINFARALAGAGVEVMTPELQDLADYHVTPQTIDVIGQSAAMFSSRVGGGKVGVIGTSFGGGLALLAAARPEYAPKMGFVLAVGAHDDMTRVAHFFVSNMVETPDHTQVRLQAHEYGVLVLAYAHLEDFFSSKDQPAARIALREWLWEQPDALKVADELTPKGKKELDLLLHDRGLLQEAFMKEIDLHKPEMDAVSPHGKLGNLTVPVFLLHGTGDSVIPASETLWLAKDIPPQQLKALLISPALIHVNFGERVPLSQKWALVDFLAQVLDATDRLRH